MSNPTTDKSTQRHRAWVKLRLHVYICSTCGTGKVNARVDGAWQTTYHCPTGRSIVSTHVPPCEVGPHTAAYLAKYYDEIAEATSKTATA